MYLWAQGRTATHNFIHWMCKWKSDSGHVLKCTQCRNQPRNSLNIQIRHSSPAAWVNLSLGGVYIYSFLQEGASRRGREEDGRVCRACGDHRDAVLGVAVWSAHHTSRVCISWCLTTARSPGVQRFRGWVGCRQHGDAEGERKTSPEEGLGQSLLSDGPDWVPSILCTPQWRPDPGTAETCFSNWVS